MTSPLLLVAGVLAAAGVDFVRVESPLAVEVPVADVEGYRRADPVDSGFWRTGNEVRVASSGGTPLPAGRLDLLERRGTSWRWVSSRATSGTEGESAPLAPGHALLHRSKARPGSWAWAEGVDVEGGLRSFRTVEVRSPFGKSGIFAFVPGRSEPVPGEAGESSSHVPFVPAGPALVCAFSPTGDSCRVVVGTEGVLELGLEGAGRWVRVLRLPDGGEATVWEPGLSLASPRSVRKEVLVAGEWLTVGVEPEKSWSELVLAVESRGRGRVRAEGLDLQIPPLWTTLEIRSFPPLAVRPLLLPERTIVVEAEARVVLLPRGSRTAVPVPVAVLSGDGEGVFRTMGVPPGDYDLRLLSGLAGSKTVEVSLSGEGVTDVEFPAGRTAKGRLVDRSGGHPPGLATVQFVRVPDPARKSPGPGKSGFEVLDWMRETASDQDGAFRVALPVAGRYRLQALWGEARGNSEFAFPEGTEEVSLGDVPISTGARVRGTLEGCAAGEVTLAPMPSLDGEAVAVGFFEFRRTPLDGAGRFEVSGLGAGTWIVGARCPRENVPVEPPFLQVPAEGDLIVRLVAAAPPAPPS